MLNCKLSTPSSKDSPAEIIEMLNGYYALMFDAITGHGGSVNQMSGDGLLAIFGAPVAYEDHCERAVKAALEMLELLAVFNQERTALNKPQIKIGVGIATGSVVAGFTGTQHRATYTCIGDTVNLAARIEAHTKVAGTPIIVDAETRAGLPDSIGVDSLGEFTFKGKTIPVQIYSVKTG